MKAGRGKGCALAPLSAAVAAAAVFVIIAAGLGYRAGWWHFLTGLRLAEWAVYASILALVGALAAAWRTRGGAGRRGFAVALLGIVLALPVVGVAIRWELAARIHPPINDISTDLDEPPVFWDMPNPTDHPGALVADQQRQGYPDLAPLRVAVPAQRVFAQALALVRERGWEIVAADETDLRIEATATSRLYGFSDEIVIRITDDDGAAQVDMRSRSRLGRIDRGVNAARIRAFLQELAPRLQTVGERP
ncbi:MAG: DUF1499 domain-containing protein [Zoogloeaceae bacterium]|nr:DUF1499 domain-containing protein [Zoogloeaceae bacterium]